ncbi:MAG TPA: 4-hydroxy-2-oxovalerate aldolase [Spirochaetota bacterium]|nr:4-hydroxy-2-oxovalerate aldolase [Spirochaetota bacterium]
MKSNVLLFDATLRDGSHAKKHQFDKNDIENYCQAMDASGMYAIIVGHGNGLGASSLQIGMSKLSDIEMLKTARDNLEKTKLGVYMIPGFGTIDDNIKPAIEAGVDLFKIGCHCTEADTTRQHIEFIKKQNKEVYGVLMMCHMASPERILEEAQKMQSYGANGVILMDSAGAFTIEMVKQRIGILYSGLNIRIGMHTHNNLGLAIANAYIAVQEGASIIDGTLRGFGGGAGNCQLEAFAALMQKDGYDLNVNLYRMLDASEDIVKGFADKNDKGLESLSIVSGLAGIFSAFAVHVQKAAERFNVDPRDIYIELGKRKAVAGQEDMIVEIAEKLSNPLQDSDISYELSSLL